MDESFFPSDNIFDPSDPEQALITQQRVVAEAWKDQTEPFRPSFQNLSETVLVGPSLVADYKVRIFVVDKELPFAGYVVLVPCF